MAASNTLQGDGMKRLTVTIEGKDGSTEPTDLLVERVLLGGYSGRDRTMVLEHIRELEDLGVKPPPRVPMVYVVDAALLQTEESMSVTEPETSGEAEFYLYPANDELLVGVGSDHTDRKQEAIDVARSKGLCAKVVSRVVWRYDDVRDHWDDLELRSWVVDRTGRHLYQEGRLDSFLPVVDLLAEVRSAGPGHLDHCVIFGGTLPTRHGFVYGHRFDVELVDPVLNRRISCGYDVLVSGEKQATEG
jgi:hypothetical protein